MDYTLKQDTFYPLPTQADVVAHAPNTRIIMYVGVPWDNTYTDVMLYNTKLDAVTDLTNKLTHKEFTGVSTLDYGAQFFVLPWAELNVKQFNYCVIINDDYPISSQHIQFGFVRKTEKMSRNATKVYWEPDIWQNNISLVTEAYSFIERAIVAPDDDVVGAYTEDEGLEIGEYVSADALPYQIPDYTGAYGKPKTGSNQIVIACSFDEDGKATGGDVIQDVYNGLSFYVFDTASLANDFIKSIIDKNLIEGIVDIFEIPELWADASAVNYQSVSINKITSGAINGYVPKNKKLYTYPYVVLHLNNNCGDSVNLRQEFFNSTKMTFKVTIPLTCNPKTYIAAENYAGINLNFLVPVNFQQFAKCAISIDSYRAWLAQTGATQFASALGGAAADYGLPISDSAVDKIATVAGALISGGTGGSILGTATNMLKKTTQAYIQPPTVIGTQGGGGLTQVGLNCVSAYRMTIRGEFARKIDNYFTCFGYKINAFGNVQNYMSSRKYWNYIKTVGCNLNYGGTVQGEDVAKLNAIFDTGVTIWHQLNNFGNYALSNTKP